MVREIPASRGARLGLESPWWADGLPFACTRCGKCCTARGEYQHVYVNRNERRRLAAYLGLSEGELVDSYTTLDSEGYRSLRFEEETVEREVFEGFFYPVDIGAQSRGQLVQLFLNVSACDNVVDGVGEGRSDHRIGGRYRPLQGHAAFQLLDEPAHHRRRKALRIPARA